MIAALVLMMATALLRVRVAERCLWWLCLDLRFVVELFLLELFLLELVLAELRVEEPDRGAAAARLVVAGGGAGAVVVVLLLGFTPWPKRGADCFDDFFADFFLFRPWALLLASGTGSAYSLPAGEFGSTVTPGSGPLCASDDGASRHTAKSAAVRSGRARGISSA